MAWYMTISAIKHTQNLSYFPHPTHFPTLDCHEYLHAPVPFTFNRISARGMCLGPKPDSRAACKGSPDQRWCAVAGSRTINPRYPWQGSARGRFSRTRLPGGVSANAGFHGTREGRKEFSGGSSQP